LEELPLALLDGVADAERDAVQRWWLGLSPADRQLVADLADERREVCFFGVPDPAEPTPLVLGGRFLAHDDAWRFGAWERDWREYLVEHSDVFLAAMFETRCYRDGDGSVCVVVDWGLTRFRGAELPPSEQRHAEPDAAPDPAGM
jgi:hypothetical protein